MKKALLFLLLSFMQVSVFGQAKIVFETFRIDFGDFDTSKAPIKAEFKFKNEGNEPLTILDVNTGYRGLEAKYPKTAIAPGKMGVITVEGRFEWPGRYNKIISVRSSGLIEMTRLNLKCNNIAEDVTDIRKEELVQGGFFIDWFNSNIKKNLAGIDKQIIYHVYIEFEIDNKGNIARVNFAKNNLPQSIINEINRLVNIAPKFTSNYYGKKIEKEIIINRYHYSNPNDKAYDVVTKGIDGVYLNRQVNGSLEDLEVDDRINNYFGIKVHFIIERDGSITNLMSDLYSNSSVKYVSQVREAINKVARVGKTKPGIADGKKCRSKYSVTVIFPQK